MLRLLFMFLVVLNTSALSHEGENHAYEEQPSTWLQIQRSVFDRKCLSCHVEGTAFARQSGLVLTEGDAYEQLVDAPPKNLAAAADGLLLVSGQGSLENSFLWLKVDAANREHFYNAHPQYGSMMPLGDFPLTNGEIELIRQWILAGAPREGKVVDAHVLEDTSKHEIPDFKPLAKPDHGVQLRVGPFRVPANRDREIYQFHRLDNPEPVFVNKIEMSMAPGSHHIVLWAKHGLNGNPPDGVIRDLYDPVDDGILNNITLMRDHYVLGAAQTPNYIYEFPPGTALRLEPNTGLDINSHYARSPNELQGEVYINLHYAQPDEVLNVAEIMWLNNTRVYIPPQTELTFTDYHLANEETHIFQMWSHGHEALQEFWIYVSEPGDATSFELVYYSDDWEHPPLINYSPPLTLQEGQRIKYVARYHNSTDQAKPFGVKSTDEMMMVFGYWVKGHFVTQTKVSDWMLME